MEQDIITAEDLADLLRLQRQRINDWPAPIGTSDSGVGRFLAAAAAAGATELVLSEGRPAMVRLGGQLRALDEDPLESPEMWQFLLNYMGEDVLDQLADVRYLARDFECEGIGRGRMTAFRHFDGACAVVRLHPDRPRFPQEAGIDQQILDCLEAKKGLILVTGQMAAGVTSTIATMVSEVVKGDPNLVMVLDDGQEYRTDQGNSEVIFRRVGRDTVDYESGLQAAIREEADVIVVGDVSSPMAFDLAMRAAEGGALVIAAINARDTQAALIRVLNFYPTYDVQRIRLTLASVLNCVLRLQLVPEKDGPAQLLATELLVLDPASRAVLREGLLSRSGLLMVMESDGSSYSMDSCLERLFFDGAISLEDAFRAADDKARFLKRTRTRVVVKD